ncbi:MAG: NUDIX hydrolase [Bacteroidota bacterium]
MYKVFYNDRVIFFTNLSNAGIDKPGALVYHFCSAEEMMALLEAFEEQVDFINELYIVSDKPKETFLLLHEYYRLIVAGGGIVRNEKGEILLIYRRGKWDLPKGKAEGDETIEQTAVREVQEECHLSRVIARHVSDRTYHTYKIKGEFVLKETVWFDMLAEGSEEIKPQEQEDITEVRWVSTDDLPRYAEQTYASIRELFKKI